MAVIDLRRYPQRLRQLRTAYENGSQDVFRRVVLESLTQIVLRTPVDTGAARANWTVNAGVVGTGSADPDRTDENGSQTIINGQNVVLRGPPVDAYVISNALPYIQRLNEGSSAQARARYIERSVNNATRRVLGTTRRF